jgi:hypothetical protein
MCILGCAAGGSGVVGVGCVGAEIVEHRVVDVLRKIFMKNLDAAVDHHDFNAVATYARAVDGGDIQVDARNAGNL